MPIIAAANVRKGNFHLKTHMRQLPSYEANSNEFIKKIEVTGDKCQG